MRTQVVAFRRFVVIARFMGTMMLRSWVVLFFSIILPTGSLLLFGWVFKSINIPAQAAGNPIATSYPVWLLPGVVVMNMMSTGMMGGSGAMIAWRERGIFKRLLVTVMPVWQVMTARIVVQLGILVLQAVIGIITAIAVFGYKFDAHYLPLTILFIAIGGLVFLSFGQVIASFTDRVEIGSVVSQVFYVALTFLTGVMLPLTILPSAAADFAKYTPSYMIVELLRTAMLAGGAGPYAWWHLAGLAGYFAAAIIASALSFRMIR